MYPWEEVLIGAGFWWDKGGHLNHQAESTRGGDLLAQAVPFTSGCESSGRKAKEH